jgi:translation initiation factor 3 subunit C
MSSRFFARGGDSDSESSDSEESLYDVDASEEESAEESEAESEEDDSDDDSSSDEEGATGINRFLKTGQGGADSDESDEEEGVIVKSAKDKRLDELEGLIKKCEDGLKIQDFQTAQKHYDELIRLVPNVTKQMNGKTPKMFIKMLADLDTNVAEAYEKSKVTPKVRSA